MLLNRLIWICPSILFLHLLIHGREVSHLFSFYKISVSFSLYIYIYVFFFFIFAAVGYLKCIKLYLGFSKFLLELLVLSHLLAEIFILFFALFCSWALSFPILFIQFVFLYLYMFKKHYWLYGGECRNLN